MEHHRRVAGRYEFVRRLGQTPVAITELAIERSALGLCRLVVIKRFGQRSTHDPRQAQQLQERARFLGSLPHPHLTSIRAMVLDDGQLSIVSDYVPGTSLKTVLDCAAEGLDAPPTPVAVGMGIDLCTAVGALHAAGAVTDNPSCLHGSIRPSNVLLSRAGCTVLADAGLGSTAEQLISDSSRHHAIQFVAPEALPRVNYALPDERTDVYAIGASVYALLALSLPFEQAPLNRLLSSKSRGAITPLLEHAPRAPEDLERVLGACLSAIPTERPSSVAELRSKLVEVLQRTSVEPHHDAMRHWLATLHAPPILEEMATLASVLGVPLAQVDTHETPTGIEEHQRLGEAHNLTERHKATGPHAPVSTAELAEQLGLKLGPEDTAVNDVPYQEEQSTHPEVADDLLTTTETGDPLAVEQDQANTPTTDDGDSEYQTAVSAAPLNRLFGPADLGDNMVIPTVQTLAADTNPQPEAVNTGSLSLAEVVEQRAIAEDEGDDEAPPPVPAPRTPQPPKWANAETRVALNVEAVTYREAPPTETNVRDKDEADEQND